MNDEVIDKLFDKLKKLETSLAAQIEQTNQNVNSIFPELEKLKTKTAEFKDIIQDNTDLTRGNNIKKEIEELALVIENIGTKYAAQKQN